MIETIRRLGWLNDQHYLTGRIDRALWEANDDWLFKLYQKLK
jgi:hypothetical protein